MELKRTWIEKLMDMSPEECMPLGDSPAASVYSAIQYNKEKLTEAGMKFRVQMDEATQKEYVCRVK